MSGIRNPLWQASPSATRHGWRAGLGAAAHGVPWLAVLAVAACSSGSSESPENFKKAIDAYLKDRARLCYASPVYDSWPNKIPKVTGFGTSMYEVFQATTKAGLTSLTRQDANTATYDLTPKGQAFAGKGPNGQLNGSICFGETTAGTIEKWAPGPANASKGSQLVFFTARTTAYEWANDPEVGKALPALQADLRSTDGKRGQVVVTLTNEGWSVVDGTVQ